MKRKRDSVNIVDGNPQQTMVDMQNLVPSRHPIECLSPEAFAQYTQENPMKPISLQEALVQIGNDVTTIKSTITHKKQKVTLHQVNEKVDLIINILNSWMQ